MNANDSTRRNQISLLASTTGAVKDFHNASRPRQPEKCKPSKMELQSRLLELEQKAARRGSPDGGGGGD